jgi:hypothetical protein
LTPIEIHITIEGLLFDSFQKVTFSFEPSPSSASTHSCKDMNFI